MSRCPAWMPWLHLILMCKIENCTDAPLLCLILLKKIRAYIRRKALNTITGQLHDANLHNSRKSTEYLEQFRVRKVLHPAFSPDPARDNFFFFGPVKSKLPGLRIRGREDLICESRCTFDEGPKVTLVSVCASCR
jgi:hypothetical protein